MVAAAAADTDVAVGEAVVEVVVAVAVEVVTPVATTLLSAAADGKEHSPRSQEADFIFYGLIPYRLVDINISGRSGRDFRRYGIPTVC